MRTFFHEQVKRHRLTFFSYHLFKTCNSCPVTQENVTFILMLLYSHNRLSMFMIIAQMNFLFFIGMLVNKCNCLLVGVIEVYFDANDYKVPAQNV